LLNYNKRNTIKAEYKWIAAGVLFALLWSSASTATKIALESSQPLVIAQFRFALAGMIMLFFAHILQKQNWPTPKQWKQVTIYGFLNITIYLGCYITAMQHITAGIGALSVATNPLFISFLSVFFLKRKLKFEVFIALLLGTAGVLIASWPLLKNSSITTGGLILLLFSMVSYSTGAIYFSSKQWDNMNILTINGWQTAIGGFLLLPFTLWQYHSNVNHFDFKFWSGTIWLAIFVSIFAVQLWLWLLQKNTMKAGLWLFLCPVFGFTIAAIVLKDVISAYTVTGVILVLLGLFLSERKSKN
jgi:probable blue pigment (indigoidine) exporter